MPITADLTAHLPHAIRFESCVDDSESGTLCDRVYDWFGQRWLAESADWVLAKPAAIVSILVIAFVIRFLLHRLIRRLAHRAAEGTVPGVLAKGKATRSWSPARCCRSGASSARTPCPRSCAASRPAS